MRIKTIAFDFDGVIHKYSKGWQDGSIYDEPDEYVIKTIFDLHKLGFSIVIISSRNNIQIANWWNSKYTSFPAVAYDNNGFFNKLDHIGVFNYKIPASAYIDDRAIKYNKYNSNLLETIIYAETNNTYKDMPLLVKTQILHNKENELNDLFNLLKTNNIDNDNKLLLYDELINSLNKYIK